MSLRPLSVLALLALPSVASAAPELRAPTSAWTYRFADSKCLATRNYGTPERRLQLVVKHPAIGDVVQVAIIRDATSRRPAQLTGQIGIDGGPRIEMSMLAHGPKGSGFRAYLINMPSSQFASLREASELSVRAETMNERLSLSQMAPLMNSIDECVANLRRAYNVTDTATGESSLLPRRARTNIARLLNNEDYPRAALSAEQSGIVKFAVLVDETGQVADCTVTGTSGVATLDAQSCAILKERAKFEPAVGADGKPAKDAVQARIVWAIQE